jgi:signal transduction histidine kinase
MEREDRPISVLLVDDDEDDFVILRDMLTDIEKWQFDLEWVSDYKGALEKAMEGTFDICFMDYFLGGRNGIQIIRDLFQNGFRAPIILLTGKGSREVDLKAMEQGAADFLEKDRLSPDIVERAIRYAITRAKTLEKLRESEHRLRVLSAQLLEAQERERKHIAQELHDSIGASLTAIKLALEQNLSEMCEENEAEGRQSLEQIASMVRHTIEETQIISTNLRPSTLDDLGIITTVRSTCREFQELHSDIRIETHTPLKEEDVPEPLKIVIYRVLQEALNNTFKHSHADTVRVSLKHADKCLELLVADNGDGFDAKKALAQGSQSDGMGLVGMKERVELSAGTFQLLSEPGDGTTIRASWPDVSP